jgi:two-component system, OmpR family, response regulator ResD
VTRVLVVDDDATVREVVVDYLGRAGLDVAEAGDGAAALVAARTDRPDLVVLDIMLPGLDGLEVCRRLRSEHGDLPVVMLSARGDEGDRVLGLEVGADDYVTKPFSPRELVLRIQSVLRRAHRDRALPVPEDPPDLLADGRLTVDRSARRTVLAGREVSLTVREFDLLCHFLENPGRVFTRDELMRTVWGWEFGDQSTVTVHVRRLREKVERDPAKPRSLVTVWGVGYRWDGDDGSGGRP